MKHLLHEVGRRFVSFVAGTLLLFCLHNSAFAEGTKQVRPDSTLSGAALIIDWDDPNFTRFCMLGCPANYRLNIHIKTVGEKILFGLKTPYNSPTPILYNLKKPNGTIALSGALPMSGTGYIQYYRQATIGPFPAYGGYTPFSVTSDVTGDWYFEITQVGNDVLLNDNCARFDLWDFQVVTGLNNPTLPTDTLNGRVWSQSWQLYARLPVNPPLEPFNGSFYVYSDDGIVTKLVCNGMYMGEGTFFCNSVGSVNTGNFPVDRQSKNSNTFVGFPGIAAYKVFLNNPDTNVYPNGQYGMLNSVSFSNDPNEICSWNKFIYLDVNKKGQVVIKIDVPYGDPSYDVFIVADVVPGTNAIPWNGRDGRGGMVPNGTILTITVDYLNGLTNLPLWDLEANPNGYKVYPVRPIGPGLLAPMLYWDDSQLTSTSNCSNAPTTVNLTGCDPAGSICHDWPVQVCHDKMINTWWYSGSTSTSIAVLFNSQPIPTITGPAPVCSGTVGSVYTTEAGMANYIWTVSAGGTITAGGGNNDNSVTVTWGVAGARTVSVSYTGTNGCPSLPTTKNVTVSNSLAVSITIAASGNPVCPNTLVTYTATPTNGGTAPSYQWRVNGTNQGTNSPVFTYTPTNGNTITCILTSNLGCATGSPATSNTISMIVQTPLTVSVSIAASANPVCAGNTATFTATVTNGGSTPTYQWKVNGNNSGTNSPTFTYYPSNGDEVTCVVTSSLPCAPGTATSNTVLMTVRTRPIPTISGLTTVCAGSTGNVYTTQSNMSNYVWVISPGGSITAGGGSGNRTVTVTWNTAGAQTVSVNYTSSGCNAVTPTVLNVTVNPRPVPTVTGPSSACIGSTGNVYTTEAGMSNYSWAVSAGGTITAGSGTNSITVTWSTTGSKTVSVNYTNSYGCTNPTATVYNVNVDNNLPVSVSIAASANPVCAGTSVAYTATPTNGGSAPSYQWKVNGVNQGTNNPIYSYTPAAGDIITCIMNSNLTCVSGNPATSNAITMTVNPLLPVSVSIAASANPICAGTSVTFTATPTNGGSSPSYQWKVNGVNQGTNSPTYTYTPVNGQTITCVLTSNATCPTGNPATSNGITMTVEPILPVSVSIAASANPVCAGTSVTYTATPTNGGSSPSYQWKVNGVNQGTNSPTYTFTPISADIITCILTSNVPCPSGNPAMSNAITMTVNPLPVPTITGPTPVCLNSTGKVYTTEAGMTNYLWTISAGGTITDGGGTTNNTVTITWTTTGAQTVSVNYTNSNGCTAATSTVYNVTVNSLPVPTLSGPTPVCLNSSANVYTTEAGMTSYSWSVSAGGTITSGGGTANNTITVTWNTTGAQTVSVNYANGNGCSAAGSTVYNVTVNSLPAPSLSGPTPVCVNSTGNVYETDAGMTSYSWSVSAGGTITAGGGTTDNTVTVTWTTAGAQTVSVNYINPDGCTAASPTVYNVTVNLLPVPVISGPTPVLLNSTGNVYTTEAGMTNYVWSVSVGGVITAGGGTNDNTVTVTWITEGAQTVSVSYTDANGCTAAASTVFDVMVLVPPDITCPEDISQAADPGLCSADLDPGFPTLNSGTLPITYTWEMTGVTTGSGSGAIVPNPYTFNVGITTVSWIATNVVGADTCTQTITITDNQLPTFTEPLPPIYCVEDIDTAIYYDPTIDIRPDRPDYYLFISGNTDLDLDPDSFADNCALTCGAEIRWRISFAEGTFLPPLPSLYNTGQPSSYPGDIELPGSVTVNVVHTITYWIVDCNGNVSLPITINITITPRPNVIKQP